ncbi:uncharacterized protein LOC128723892 [Anopheles nili]|uniref:uncharacterized protein LOC128723892 n=1 Tax=Anopheles nili TaxID=185578 RepID=UPI00237BE858|nr:uncharacterized protein LOC128723892 [Anopheles nili]
MLWKWLEDNFKYRRKRLLLFGRRSPSVLEVSGRAKISKKQYDALLVCVDYLERNITVHGLFVISGSVLQVKKIFDKIRSGCPHLEEYLRTVQAPRECAMAFQQFLSIYRVQVLPQRCTDVIVGDVASVPKRLIALDVLNLLHEEFDDTRLNFAKRYLQLMRRYTVYGYLRPTEVHIALTPFLALPKILPGPHVRRNMLSKSMTLLELFLLAGLLDDPVALSEELHQACVSYWGATEGKKGP